MKTAWFFVIAMSICLTACKGGENAERAGANVDGSEAEVTAPLGGDPPTYETSYNPRSETTYAVRSETSYRPESGPGGTLPTDGM